MQLPPEACSKCYFVMPSSEIHVLRFILEGYEGIGLLTTMDSKLGLVELNIAPGCEEDVARLLSVEGNNLQLRPVVFDTP